MRLLKTSMPILFRWILVILGATAVDLLMRFRLAMSFTAVLWAEAILFPLTGLVLGLLLKASPNLTGFKRGIQIALVWGFFLAGIRSGIWVAGVPVGAANLLIFLSALGGWLAGWAAKRRRVRPGR